MEEIQVTEPLTRFAGEFTDATVVLNQSVCYLRVLAGRLSENFKVIDGVYRKVTLGGLARQSSALVFEVNLELETLQGLCWSAINKDCENSLELSFDDWLKIGSEPPPWLREVFENAILLSALPDEPSLVNIAKGKRVLVVRAPDLKGDSLLPQVAALMPEGFSVTATQIWWPWVMGGQTPVVLEPSATLNVLNEVSADGFLQTLQVEPSKEAVREA